MTGATPIDSAFAFLGMVYSANILKMFTGYKLHIAVGLVGIIITAIASIKDENYKPMVGYIIIASSIWLAFNISKAEIGINDIRVMTQQRGNKSVMTITDYVQDTKQAEVSSLFSLITSAIDGIIYGMVDAIDGWTLKEKGFFPAPFAFLRAQNLMAATAISDQFLHDSFVEFITQCYSPALVKFEGDYNTDTWRSDIDVKKVDYNNVNWPGSQILKDKYYPSISGCTEKWKELSDGLTKWTKNEKLVSSWDKLASYFAVFDNKNEYLLKRIIMNTLSQKETQDKIARDILKKSGSRNFFTRIMGVGSTIQTYITVASAIELFFDFAPKIQAYAILIAYSSFPVFLILALLPKGSGILITYFGSIFWIKSWTFMWAMINLFSIYGTQFLRNTKTATGMWEQYIEYPVEISIISMIMLLISPFLSLFLIKGSIDGIIRAFGHFSSSGNLVTFLAVRKLLK